MARTTTPSIRVPASPSPAAMACRRRALLVAALALAALGCSDRDGGPLAPRTDESGLDPAATDSSPPILIGPSPRTSGAIAASPSSPLDPLDSNSWIFVDFSGRMDPASAAGVVVHDSAGTSLELHHEWSLGATTGLIVRPAQRLEPNTLYVFRILGDRVRDQGMNPLDIDGDGVGGEHPDDDLVFFFRTQRAGDLFTDLDRDGRWDSGSVFEDRDRNGRYEPPPAGPDSLLFDTFDDGSGAPTGDGVLNPVEPLITDENGNGVGDPGDAWFDNIENGVWDAAAEPLIVDRNANRVFDAPAPGDRVPLLVDGFPPVMTPFSATMGADGFVQFRAGGDDDTQPYVDAAVAVRVVDEALIGGVIERTGLDSPLPGEALVLEEVDAGTRVGGRITYERTGEVSSDTFGRLTLTPDGELRPGVTYRLLVNGALADTAGNKLDRDRDGWADSGTRPRLIRTFTTLALRSDGTVVASDILPPEVVEFESEASGFVVVFSELVDPRTITDSTIRLTVDGRRAHGLLSRGSRFLGDPNQGPEVRLVTTARLLPLDPSVRAGRVTVTTGVRDFAGNRLRQDAVWLWTAIGGGP